MKKIRSSGRNAAEAPRLLKFITSLALCVVICSPAAGIASESYSLDSLQGTANSPRQVAHLRVDKTFNTTGFRADRYARSNDSVASAVRQPDGKVIIGVLTTTWWNSSWPLAQSGFEIVRLNVDGSKDTTFGDGCRLEPDVNTSSFPLIALQPDGKIITTGVSSNVMRCNPDGTVDISFGVNGLRPTSFGFSVGALARQSDGKIVVGGTSASNFRLARLNEDGSSDTAFDGALAGFPSSTLRSIAVQQDGKIVAAGSSAGDFALARFNPNGSLDATFDGDGKLTTPIFSGNDEANSVLIQPDGKILAAGYSLNSTLITSGVFALLRYNPDGSLDTTFDGDGKVTTPVINTGVVTLGSIISSIAITFDGKIVATGQTHNGMNFDQVTSRYNADGSLDTTFGAGGFVLPPFPAVNDHREEFPSVVLARPDGRILLLGNTTDWRGGIDVTVWQLNTDGSTDTSFGSGGKADFDFAGQRAYGAAVVVQPDGRTLVAGHMSTGTENGQEVSVIARYNADGTRDSSFGSNGFVLQNERVDKIAIGSDGKIAAGGGSTIVKYNSDGTLDTTFDGDGRVTNVTSLGGLLFQPDGKLLTLNLSVVTRLAVNGSLDTSFDGDGRGSLTISAVTMKLQPDGKIVAGGNSGDDFAVARLSTNGVLDTTFDGDGVATTNISGTDNLFTMALQPDGKIVAAGRYTCCGGTAPTGFVRYNPDGSLDTSFGDNGRTLVSNGTAYQALNIQPNGKILAVHRSSAFHIIRLNADGQPDSSFYGDGVGTFHNNKFRTDRVPVTDFTAFDSLGRMIFVGSDRSTSVCCNQIKSLFIGRVEIVDRGYVHFDYNGDGKADLAVWRPSTNTWYVHTPDRFIVTQQGLAGDKPVPADYDGDGITDLAVFRASNGGNWHIINSETQTSSIRGSSGGTSPMPIPSDRDGDGIDDLVIYRNSNQNNELFSETLFTDGAGRYDIRFGVIGDRPVRGDFDGNGQFDTAVYRPSNHNWYIISSSTTQGFYVVEWGADGDVPVPGDYDGDGKTDIAVWRPSTGRWWILGSTLGWMTGTVWGEPGDKPVPADYDADGKTDIAVWRPSNGTWYIVNSTNGTVNIRQFGESGDIPLPNVYIY